jgi:hypothetical protein
MGIFTQPDLYLSCIMSSASERVCLQSPRRSGHQVSSPGYLSNSRSTPLSIHDRLPEKPTIKRDHLVVSVAFIRCSDISMVRVRFRHKHSCVSGPAAEARSCDSAPIDGQTDICTCSHLSEQVYGTSFPRLSPQVVNNKCGFRLHVVVVMYLRVGRLQE